MGHDLARAALRWKKKVRSCGWRSEVETEQISIPFSTASASTMVGRCYVGALMLVAVWLGDGVIRFP